MWTVEVLATGIEATGPLANGGAVEGYRSLAGPVRAGGLFLGTLVVAMVALGLFQEYGQRSVGTARRSPIISICIGLPTALVVAGLARTGQLIVGTSLGTFFGIPLVVVGLIVLPALTTVGFVAIGRSLAARVGRDGLGAGVLVGSLLAGLAGLSVWTTIAVGALAAALGVGAGVRALFSAAGTTQPGERTVPPANKI